MWDKTGKKGFNLPHFGGGALVDAGKHNNNNMTYNGALALVGDKTIKKRVRLTTLQGVGGGGGGGFRQH